MLHVAKVSTAVEAERTREESSGDETIPHKVQLVRPQSRAWGTPEGSEVLFVWIIRPPSPLLLQQICSTAGKRDISLPHALAEEETGGGTRSAYTGVSGVWGSTSLYR